MHVKVINSLIEFLEIAESWNQLWHDSKSHVALHRAEPIASFVKTFGYSDQFVAITIEHQNRLVFGLPLLIRRNRWGQQFGHSLANEWYLQACLLKAAGTPASMLSLVSSTFERLGLFQVKLNWLPLNWSSSQSLLQEWNENKQTSWLKPRFEVSYWSVPADWKAFWHQIHSKRKKKYEGFEKKIAADGPVQLVQYDGSDLEHFDQYFDHVLSVEHAGWKGRSGTSLRSNPAIAKLYFETYRELAAQGLLRIYLLTVRDRPIAVDLGYLVNGVYSSQKVSYLEDYSKFTPGQLLNAKLFEHWSMSGEVQFIDCVGEVSEATKKWGSETYQSGQITLSTAKLFSKASVFALDSLANLMGKNTLNSISGSPSH
jgi:CelD/BcsL family acetyltransferase involved in cellulose biosynthesis